MSTEASRLDVDPREGRGRPAAELRRRPGPRGVQRPVRARRDGQPGPRAEQRQLRLLQRQHAHQPDERLRLHAATSAPSGPTWTSPKALRDDRRADRRAGRRGRATAARPSCTSSAGCTTSCRTSSTSTSSAWIHEAAPEICTSRRTRRSRWVVRARSDRPADERRPRRADRRRPGQPARRRGRDLPSRGPRADLRAQGRRPRAGSTSTATAHQLGLHSNATMLYGHIEKPEHRIDHLVRLRELQDETGGFQTFIPLAFHPDNSRMDAHPQAVGRDGPEDDGDQPADARQLPAHQGVLGDARHQDRPGRPRASGPTTSTAPSSTRRSTTTPAPRRRRR